MVAFVASVLISVGLFGVGIWYMHRRPADPKGTWGESMVGAVYVFGTLFWIFGVVPHQFILWADSDLGWRVDRSSSAPARSSRTSRSSSPTRPCGTSWWSTSTWCT